MCFGIDHLENENENENDTEATLLLRETHTSPRSLLDCFVLLRNLLITNRASESSRDPDRSLTGVTERRFPPMVNIVMAY